MEPDISEARPSFDIHLGAWSLPHGLSGQLCRDLEFKATNFSMDYAAVPYDPPRHLSLKIYEGRRFREVFERARATIRRFPETRGYLEGEFIVADDRVRERHFDPKVSAPFCASLAPTPKGEFRDAEIHISMCRSRSDPGLWEMLHKIGFSSHVPKSWGMTRVFTLAGSRRMIDSVHPLIHRYLHEAGGSVRGMIKVERVAQWWISDLGIPLPPLVQSIQQVEPRILDEARPQGPVCQIDQLALR